MVSTKTLTSYIFLVVIFYGLCGTLNLLGDNETEDYSINLYTVELFQNANEFTGLNIVNKVIQVVLVPFMVIELILSVFILIGIGFAVLPSAINLLLFAPLGIIIIFEYVAPMFRGN